MALLGRLNAPEYLRFVGRMYGLDRETTNRRTEELLEFMQLANERRKLITDFSHGMQKKLAMAAAVIHGPKVLFLDEPFEGVDAIAAGMLKSDAAGNDPAWSDDLFDHACARDCRAALQPRSHHSSGPTGGQWVDREFARGRSQCLARSGEQPKADARRDFPIDRGSKRPGAGAGVIVADLGAMRRNELMPAGAGLFSRLARTQYAALVTMRWRMFAFGLRSIRGILELGASGIELMIFSFVGLGLGIGLGFASHALASHGMWLYPPIEFWVLCLVWQMIPVSLASFQDQFDLSGLLRFPVSFGSFFVLYVVFGLADISTILGLLCCAGIWIGIALGSAGVGGVDCVGAGRFCGLQCAAGASRSGLGGSLAGPTADA